jgi:ribose transport system ATP-binding protein
MKSGDFNCPVHDGHKEKFFRACQRLWAWIFELKAGRDSMPSRRETALGKSTLIKIMTGAYRRDSGFIEYDQNSVAFQNPTEAQAVGTIAVYQEIQRCGFPNRCRKYFLGKGAASPRHHR